ncbi:traB domain-containing protein-like [Sycon ciliatum]|uniref:traB domain-containing protein-like n=1 Tax=Sycon ciliatum TaxID=27933 RepID=UPI0031F70BE6|eukprot:scpid72885/ scgid24177/ TraB domain-containing protein; Protein TTG2
MASNKETAVSPQTAAETSAASFVPREYETDSGVPLLLRGDICEADLPKTVTVLKTSKGARVFLVGTAHFSPESCDDVTKTMQLCQPDILMLEICESRSSLLQLTDEEVNAAEADTDSAGSWDLMRRFIEQKGAVQGCFQYFLTRLTRRLSARLGRMAGGEFRAGYIAAKKIPHCRFHLGDRPIQVTFSRLLGQLSAFQKIRLFFHILRTEINVTPEDVEEYKNKDLLEKLLVELGEQFPTVVEVLVNERDRYMAFQLQCLCRQQPQREYGNNVVKFDGEAPVIVAVVGIGHAKGISQYFYEPITNIRELASVPRPVPASRLWVYTKRTAFYGLVFYGAYRVGRRFMPAVAIGWASSLYGNITRLMVR